MYKQLLKSAILCCCLLAAACSRHADTDYAKELAALNEKIIRLGTPATKDDALKLVYYRYQFACLSGDYSDFRAAENSIDAALATWGPTDDLHYFSAQLNFKMHRLQSARQTIALMAPAAHSLSLNALLADMALQQGRYAEALDGYEKLLAEKKSWDNLARLAHYRLKTGQVAEADELYRRAADMIPARDMRSYAWIELQRGLLDLEYGRHAQALEHYRLADRAYSGYWLIEEHIAEALLLSGRTDDAVALYRNIIGRTPHPEFIAALAAILKPGDAATAATLYSQADILYARQYELYPEAVAGHLIEYLLRKQEIDPRLQPYAEQNHALRPNAEAKLLLARAWLKLGNVASASSLLNEILQTPWRTPEVSALAAEVEESGTGKDLNG
jgi:tetratricopeptide (TPR) repeat protein